jgi:hypothetical protein
MDAPRKAVRIMPTCDRCGYAHPDFGHGYEMLSSDDQQDLASLPWRVNKGKPGRSQRVRLYVESHAGASAIEVIRALDLSGNPYGRSYSEPIWAAINDGMVYDAAQGKNWRYVLMPVDLELAALVAAAEAEPDLLKRMDLIDQMGERIRAQVAAA